MSRKVRLSEIGRVMLGLGAAVAMLVAASSITAPAQKMAADIVPLYPRVSPLPNKAYKVVITYNKNGGTGTMAKQSAVVNGSTKIKLVANKFTKSGYTFNGWNTKKDGKGTHYANGASVKLTKDTTLYAQWKKVSKVTVTFNKNGGAGTMTNQSIKAGTATKLKKNTFTRKGYEFAGWNTKKDGKGTKYANGAAVKLTKNTVLYAQWKKILTNTLEQYQPNRSTSTTLSNVNVLIDKK